MIPCKSIRLRFIKRSSSRRNNPTEHSLAAVAISSLSLATWIGTSKKKTAIFFFFNPSNSLRPAIDFQLSTSYCVSDWAHRVATELCSNGS
jgi:hypothetical protein